MEQEFLKEPTSSGEDRTSLTTMHPPIFILSSDSVFRESLGAELQAAGFSCKICDPSAIYESEGALCLVDYDSFPVLFSPPPYPKAIVFLSRRDLPAIEIPGVPTKTQKRPFELLPFFSLLRELDAVPIAVSEVAETKKIDKNDLRLIPGKRVLQNGEKLVRLTPKEYTLCAQLMAKGRSFLSRSEIMTLLDGKGNAAEVYICKLRKKLLTLGIGIVLKEQGYRMERQ